jgi:hypothetical protein
MTVNTKMQFVLHFSKKRSGGYRNNSQIQTLKKTRDTLLPKLMSGQVRVDEFKETAV